MYKYSEQRPRIFTEDGQVDFLKVRDNVNRLLDVAGAVSMERAISVISGDSWEQMSNVDRMVELGEIRELPRAKIAGQHRVFVRTSQ